MSRDSIIRCLWSRGKYSNNIGIVLGINGRDSRVQALIQDVTTHRLHRGWTHGMRAVNSTQYVLRTDRGIGVLESTYLPMW